MSITRIGKIGRLYRHIRDRLGHRIADGEPGKESVKWLNDLPDVQKVLKEQFGGRPITEQNLSEWKQAGHPEWLRQEETRLVASRLTEQSDGLDEAADGHPISDRFGTVLTVELIQLTRTLLEKETDPEKRWQILCAAHRELSQLRCDDNRAARTRIKRDRWNREGEREQEEELEHMKQESKKHLRELVFSRLQNQNMAELFGGGEYGKNVAEMLHRIKFDLPMDDLVAKTSAEKPGPVPIQPNPTESNLIQPNPTNFSNGQSPEP